MVEILKILISCIILIKDEKREGSPLNFDVAPFYWKISPM